MKYFYTYQQNAFEPIAHERVLVHVHYERISSFLSQIFGLEFSTILAKPIVKGNQVNWSNSYKAELIRISELDEEKRANVLEKYWQFREAVDLKIEEFDGTDQTEKKEWSAILKKVFDENNNILFSDQKGELLSIVWGGGFNNNKENPKSEKYIAFENRNTTPPVVIPTSEIVNTEDEASEAVAEENIEEVEFVADQKNISTKNRRTKKYTFWQVCDRSITWFCFRYWWIALLTFIILLLLLLCCWWGYFDKHRVCVSNDEINQRIIDIENNLEFCCDCIEEDIEIEEEIEEEEEVIAPPTNEERTCISIIDETDSQTQNTINNSWRKFREEWPDRPFYIFRPIPSDDVFFKPTTSPNDWTYKNVNRDEGNRSKASDWFLMANLDKLPRGSKIAVLIDESGSMDRTAIEASYNLFIKKVKDAGLVIVAMNYNDDENYIEPFNRDLNN